MAVALGIPWPEDWYSALMRFPETVRASCPTLLPMMTSRLCIRLWRRLLRLLCNFAEGGRKTSREFFTVRIERIRALLAEVEPYEKERVEKIRARLEENLAKIEGVISRQEPTRAGDDFLYREAGYQRGEAASVAASQLFHGDNGQR